MLYATLAFIVLWGIGKSLGYDMNAASVPTMSWLEFALVSVILLVLGQILDRLTSILEVLKAMKDKL